MFTSTLLISVLATACTGDSGVALQDLAFQPESISSLVRTGMRRVDLVSARPAHVKAPPAGAATGWASWSFGPKDATTTITVALQEESGVLKHVWADVNGDADLTNDPEVAFQPVRTATNDIMYHWGLLKTANKSLHSGPVQLKFVRYGSSEAQRRRMPADQLVVSADYGLIGNVMVGTQPYRALIVDGEASGDFTHPRQGARNQIFVDGNLNGRFDDQERFEIGDTMNAGDTAFVVEQVSANGREVRLAAANKQAPRIRAPEGSAIGGGGMARSFVAKAMDGVDVKFPQDFKGKLVLLDFWATWCGPCKREVPHLVKAYKKYHEHGFDILGVSSDRSNDGQKLRDYCRQNDMPWRQIFPGGRKIGGLWNISAIPRMFLVDGDTGEIVASGTALRNGSIGLDKIVAAAIEKKFGKKVGGSEAGGARPKK